MRILAVHNYYQQRGGEDQCFEDEVRVLRVNGHEVQEHLIHNDLIDGANKWKVALETIWSKSAYRTILTALNDFKPDLMHVMNTFPLLSPSIFYAARKVGVPSVHEVQNYRLSCAGGFLLRDGKICEKCVGRTFPVSAIRHRCYRGSLAGSSVLAATIAFHRQLKTWHKVVDTIMCPSEIAKKKLIESGLPADRIEVKQNSLDTDPGLGQGASGFVVFVGRLSPEKGLHTLVQAWKQNPQLPRLKIIGDGPLLAFVEQSQANDDRIEWLGRMPIPSLLEIVGQANCLVMPSVWYETFGRTTVEAFAKGTPVVGARIGGTAEIIDDGRTGWLFNPGDPTDLAAKVEIAMRLTSDQATQFRNAARQEYLRRYTAQGKYDRLMEVYRLTLARASARARTSGML